MKYRKLGLTELDISEIGVGLWPLSNILIYSNPNNNPVYVLNQALDLGINYFDTSSTYQNGQGEELIAKILGGARSHSIVGTKFIPTGYDSDRASYTHNFNQHSYIASIKYECEQSLRRLNSDYIDLYQIQNPAFQMIEDDELFEALELLVYEGKIRYYGASLEPGTSLLEEGQACITCREIPSVQLVHNILQQNPLVDFDSKHVTGFIASDINASGMLTNKESNYTLDIVSDPYQIKQKIINDLNSLIAGTDCSLSQLATLFILANTSITTTLLDISSNLNLNEAAHVSNSQLLTEDMMKDICRVMDDHNQAGDQIFETI